MGIDIQNLNKYYGSFHALKDINLSLKSGEVVGLVGPNGAGKTTLMRCLTGAMKYEEGSIRVAGHEVREERLQAAAHIGYLPEMNPLYDEMYIREYLQFMGELGGQKISGKDLQIRIRQLVEQLQLTPHLQKKNGELSKGTRQRVGLAQALLHNPDILILDEPTTGLDPNQLQDFHGIINSLSKDKLVILSTHILQEVQAVCNRVVMIGEGRVIRDLKGPSLMQDVQAAFEEVRN